MQITWRGFMSLQTQTTFQTNDVTIAPVKGKTQAWILFEATQGTPGAARFLFYGPQGE